MNKKTNLWFWSSLTPTQNEKLLRSTPEREAVTSESMNSDQLSTLTLTLKEPITISAFTEAHRRTKENCRKQNRPQKNCYDEKQQQNQNLKQLVL